MMHIQEELEEFNTIRASNLKTEQRSDQADSIEDIMKACRHLRSVIIHQAIQNNIDFLVGNLLNHKEKAQIFPIQLKQNQEEDLPTYLYKLEKRIEKGIKDQKDPLYPLFDLDNDKIIIKEQFGTDVRDITLSIHNDSEDLDGAPQFALYIYIVKNVTDLSEDNMYVFSKGITNKRFIAFVPTYETFDQESYEMHEKLKYEKLATQLYDSKALFCQYIYECIKNPKIKAYLPPETTKLISDMDYYSLGYAESCRRFDYVQLRALQLNPKERPEVDFGKIISSLEAIVGNKFKYYPRYRTNLQKIIKVIYDQHQRYEFSGKAIAIEVELRLNNRLIPDKIDQDIFIHKIKDSLLKYLDPAYTKYIREEEEPTAKIHRHKKKTREEKLGLNEPAQLTPKMKLQNQITALIKSATSQIRKFAKTIKWKDIHFQERIKPCIPYQIVRAMKEEEDSFPLVEEITSNFYRPLSCLLSLFPEDQIGYGLYLIKTLELSGLFTLSRRQINPFAYNNYFEKTKFRN